MTQPGAWTPEIERRTQVEAYQQALRQRIAEAEREDSYSPDAVLTVENVERVTSNAVGIGAVAIAAGLLVLLLSRK